MATANTKPPQNGAVTHHQDHVILPNNFKVTKTTPNRPNTPMPLLVVVVLLLMASSVHFAKYRYAFKALKNAKKSSSEY